MDFLDADGLAGEDLAEIDFFVAQTNAAAACDHDGFVMEGIIDIGQAGVRAWRRLIDFCGTLHIQSFMRALLVEDVHELVEAGLLLEEVGGGRFRGLFFQGEMHAFVAAILLRMARLDALNANAEAKPPDGKFAEVEQSIGRCKRDTIVAADVRRQATFLKKALKDGESVVFPDKRKRFASEQETTGVIGNGEGIRHHFGRWSS